MIARTVRHRRRLVPALVALAMTGAACSGGDDTTEPSTEPSDVTSPAESDAASSDKTATSDAEPTESSAPSETEDAPASITLVAYDSFPDADTSLNDALATFTDETGIGVDVLIAGDTGTMLSKAALTVGNPEGDVMFGIDNTFLSRAIGDGVFEPVATPVNADLPAELTELSPDGLAVPIDFGDVCVNYDIGWFADAGLEPPTALDDLIDPTYADLLVIQNPATSSVGLAFLLATIDEFGDDGWQDYWTALTTNGVEVLDGWTDAYYGSFTWAGGGDRPLVVSYGSSPPAEVIFADPARDDAPTGVVESTCFRQVEFAGVLAGTEHPAEAAQLLDFLVGETFQSELALNLFVYPSNPTVALPQEFIDFAVVPDAPRAIASDRIDENRSEWIDEWTAIVLG
jgi:thiamine transport system substrate-binding protein